MVDVRQMVGDFANFFIFSCFFVKLEINLVCQINLNT